MNVNRVPFINVNRFTHSEPAELGKPQTASHHIFGVLFFGAKKKSPPQKRTLVGGFNASEKYVRQIVNFPQIPGWKSTNIWNHQLEHLNQHVRPRDLHYLHGPHGAKKNSPPKIQHWFRLCSWPKSKAKSLSASSCSVRARASSRRGPSSLLALSRLKTLKGCWFKSGSCTPLPVHDVKEKRASIRRVIIPVTYLESQDQPSDSRYTWCVFHFAHFACDSPEVTRTATEDNIYLCLFSRIIYLPCALSKVHYN